MLQISPLSNFRLSAAVEVLSAWKRRWIVQETFSTSRKIMCGYQNVTLPKPPWCHGEEDHIRTLELLFCIPTTEISKIVHNRMLTTCAWILGAFIKSSGHNGAKYCVCLAWRWGLFWRCKKVNCQMLWHLQRGAIQVINQIVWIFFQLDCCIQIRYLSKPGFSWGSNLFAKPVFPRLQPEDTHQLCSNISKWLAAFCAPLGALPQVEFSFCQPFPRIHCCPMTGC